MQGVRQRYKSLSAAHPETFNAATAPLDVEVGDDDDYEPYLDNAEDTEQILNKLDSAPPPEIKASAPDMALARFALPPPPPLSSEEAIQVGQGTVSRVFGVMQTLEEKGKKSKAGINRLAASAYDRDAWITIISRLATRSPAGLEEVTIKQESENDTSVANGIRQNLYAYILEDFRKRIDIAVAWLCEEWYNDKVQLTKSQDPSKASLNYEKWALKILDGISPYLDGQDRALVIKFLGDIPGLSIDVLERIKGLCGDPATVPMALQSLLYLVAFRPPVRELVLDIVEDVWGTCELFYLSRVSNH
jgi:symplekin